MTNRRWALAICAVIAMLAGPFVLLVPAATAATATVAVTPSTGLVDGQSVVVTGTGWTANASIGLCEAVPSLPTGPGECNNGAFTLISADSSGHFTQSLIVRRTITPPNTGVPVDCAAASNPCAIGAADASDVAGTAAGMTIEFNPNTCLALVANPHTSFTLSDGELVGSVATFVADNDYVLSGSASLTCQPNLTWDGAPPTALFTGTPVVVPGTGSVIEGNAGTTSLPVSVTLSQASAATVTAHWATLFVPGAAGNQADPASDYTSTSGTVTFAPGETAKTVTITVNGDTLVEPDEYIIVSFTNPTNARMGGIWGLGVGTITNDDHAVVLPGTASVAEGNSGTTDLNVPVTLSNPSTQTVTVQWRTLFVPGAAGNQADPASDYSAANGTVTFAPGETAMTVTISVNGDTLAEPDEYIIVSFTNPTNARMGGIWGLGVGTIINDD
jgi:hypothetical protein